MMSWFKIFITQEKLFLKSGCSSFSTLLTSCVLASTATKGSSEPFSVSAKYRLSAEELLQLSFIQDPCSERKKPSVLSGPCSVDCTPKKASTLSRWLSTVNPKHTLSASLRKPFRAFRAHAASHRNTACIHFFPLPWITTSLSKIPRRIPTEHVAPISKFSNVNNLKNCGCPETSWET